MINCIKTIININEELPEVNTYKIDIGEYRMLRVGKVYLALQVLTISMLIGCSALDVIKNVAGGAMSKGGIEVDAQIGDRELEGNIGGVQGSGKIEIKDGNAIVTTNVTKSKVEQAESVEINNYETPVWLIIALVLGWILPTPLGIIKGTFKYFRGLSILKGLRKDKESAFQKRDVTKDS